ncbi:MAG: HD domain-containing protein [Jiangellaceae bacterium]
MNHLIARWRDLVADEDTGRDLLERWSEPHRRYHDVRHLRAVLDAIDELAGDADDPDAVRLAAWFHDAVYAGRPGQDERESAALAATTLSGLGVDEGRIAEVVRLVELTATHEPAPADLNGAVLCDADLAVLGRDPAAYADYAAAVRAEYAHVADKDFRRGRVEVLGRLLSRDRLFHTVNGRRRWEGTARRNLTTELALLRAGASAS